MLISAKLPLPRQVFGHGFMTVGGQRMSKSLGTAIDPTEAAARFGPDPLRLYLTKEITFGSDGDFSWERYDERYNVDLANNLGNLVSRVSAMAGRYRHGRIRPTGATSERLARVGEEASNTYRRAMNGLAVHEGAAAAFRLVDTTNEFIAEAAPWALAKEAAGADRLTQVLFDAAEAIRLAAVLLTPFMPASGAEILRRMGAASGPLSLDRDGRWRNEGERVLLQEGPIWPRTDRVQAGVADVQARRKEIVVEQPMSPGAPVPPVPPVVDAVDRISIDDFMKVELRVAKVLSAERVPKSTRLLKLQVDVGSEHRTIVAGIAEAYEPEAIVGRTVVVVFNLKPAKLMGVESNGMVLAASPDGGKAMLVGFEETPEPGTRVR
jgi:methionyl-tRNA synthetase